MYEALLSKIKEYPTIILHRHTKPDGDALGSQIGLCALLKENFPEKRIYMVGDAAGTYSFLEGAVMDDLPDEAFSGALSLILDCGSEALVSDDRYTLAGETFRVDHHVFSGRFATEEIVDSSYESCCGMLAHFARESGLRLNRLAAKSLYTGMVTDSGRFRYDATTARTHELAAFLMTQAFDTQELYRDLYSDTLENKMLRAKFLLKTQFVPGGIAYIYTTKEEFDALGLDEFTVSRGMVNTMADLRGVEIWVNFTETEKGVLCELRSADKNINPIAVKYGGGGHKKASGATLKNREEAMALLRDLQAMKGEEA